MEMRLFLGVLQFWGIPTAPAPRGNSRAAAESALFWSILQTHTGSSRAGKRLFQSCLRWRSPDLLLCPKDDTFLQQKAKQAPLFQASPSVSCLALSWVPSPLHRSRGDPTASLLSHPSRSKELHPREGGLGKGITSGLGDHGATSAGSRGAPSPKAKAELGMQKFLPAGRD